MVRVSAIFVPPYKSQDLLTYTFLIIYLRTHFVTYLKFQTYCRVQDTLAVVSVPKVSSLWSSVKRQFMNMADRRTDRQTNTMPQQMSGKKLKLITTE